MSDDKQLRITRWKPNPARTAFDIEIELSADVLDRLAARALQLDCTVEELVEQALANVGVN